MKRIFSLLAFLILSQSAWAGTCEVSLMPAFTANQAVGLCKTFASAMPVSLIPSTDNTLNIGSASKRWAAEFLGGDLTINTAAKGLVAGETARAANVTTATTLAVPLYLSAAAAGTDLAAFVGSGVSASGPVVDLFKTRATSGQATTIVVNGDSLGTIRFLGANGTTYDVGAQIVAKVDGTPGASTDLPASIDFQVSPDGSATPASALKLGNDKFATFGANVRSSAAAPFYGSTLDTSTTTFGGGSGAANSNGAILVMSGATAGVNPGDLTLSAANVTGGEVTISAPAASGSAIFINTDSLNFRDKGGVALWSLASTGVLSSNASTGGALTMNKPAADLNLSGTGSTVSIQEATAGSACSGSVTANGTTPVVTSTSCAVTGSRIFLTKTANSTVNGSCFISAISTGTSFSITCLATDTGTYNFLIFHEAP